jgi:hypothetical protein
MVNVMVNVMVSTKIYGKESSNGEGRVAMVKEKEFEFEECVSDNILTATGRAKKTTCVTV